MPRFMEMKQLEGSQLSHAFNISRASQRWVRFRKTILEPEKVLIDMRRSSTIRRRSTDAGRSMRFEL
jgi:hypothetical protein